MKPKLTSSTSGRYPGLGRRGNRTALGVLSRVPALAAQIESPGPCRSLHCDCPNPMQ